MKRMEFLCPNHGRFVGDVPSSLSPDAWPCPTCDESAPWSPGARYPVIVDDGIEVTLRYWVNYPTMAYGVFPVGGGDDE